MLVSGCGSLPMEDLVKHEVVESPRAAQFTGATQDGQNQGLSPSPCRPGEETHRPLSYAHLQCQLTAQFRAPASGKEIL